MTILMAGMIGVAVFIGGGVIDYMSVANQKNMLQGVADRAAVAAAQELIVAKASEARIDSVAASFVDANYQGKQHATDATIIDNGKAVQVSITAKPQTFFPGPMADAVKEIKVEATAEIAGGGYVCMIGLDTKAPSTLNMRDGARLTAEGCAIYSNSKNKASLTLRDTARVKADLVCVAGGVFGPVSAVSPEKPVEDCPPIEDPLKDRPEPNYAGLLDCDYIGVVVLPKQKVTLSPGTYCGGITVAGGEAKLKPGVYVMNNGLLAVTASGKLIGDNVGFFLTGEHSTILFTKDTTISLTAPKTGVLAGILFFEDRDTTFSTFHIISSNNARNLVGTMYFPKSKLRVDAKNPVADQSDYTVIIAREFELRDGPELVLNTDYEHSPIPVPEGVGNKARPVIRLAK
jgi:hypothetical protein